MLQKSNRAFRPEHFDVQLNQQPAISSKSVTPVQREEYACDAISRARGNSFTSSLSVLVNNAHSTNEFELIC